MKQVIVIRTDLKMGKGKIAAQAAHASVAAFLSAKQADRDLWLDEGMKKAVLKVSNEKELSNIFKLAKKNKLPAELITDAGLTQIKTGTHTSVGIGPASESKIDRITGKLKLL